MADWEGLHCAWDIGLHHPHKHQAAPLTTRLGGTGRAPGTAIALKWQWLPPDLRSAMYRSNPTSSLPPAAKQLRSADRYLQKSNSAQG